MDKYNTRKALIKVFRVLRKDGLIARADFYCCSNCAGFGLAEIAEKGIESGRLTIERIKGCVTWHHQNEQNLQRRGSLMLGYGSLHVEKYGNLGMPTVDVGNLVAKRLKEANINFKWNGKPENKICVYADGVEV